MVEGLVSGGVRLSGGVAASVLLYEVLSDSVRAFPNTFSGLEFPDSSAVFRDRYPSVLPWFEAARADSPDRSQIAEALAREAASKVVWELDGSEMPLAEKVGEKAEPLDLETEMLGVGGGLSPSVVLDGEKREGSDLVAAAAGLVEDGFASRDVLEGVSWIVEEAGSDGINLQDRRIVVMGASAELAPTRLFLAGGADVLWIDLTPPPQELFESEHLSGTVSWVEGGSNLLTQPSRIRATIEQFAGNGTVDIGLYAYAPGQTREWRLTAAMNAIVDSLTAETVRTITLLVSPTTCGVLLGEDLEFEARRMESRPAWQTLLQKVGLLGRGPGHVRSGDTHTNRGIVPIQGTSYAAAQYLGKLIPSELWATSNHPFRVSANTAGVSRTASISHPVFDTAFDGAAAFGVRTFASETTAALNGLLTIRDWLAPTTDDSHTPNTPTSTRIHGGIYNLPYPLDSALKIAAGLGSARHPQRIISMLRN